MKLNGLTDNFGFKVIADEIWLQVAHELHRMSARLLRLNEVHNMGQAKLRLAVRYLCKGRIEARETPGVERVALKRQQTIRCPGGLNLGMAKIWTPGVSEDELKLDHAVISNPQIAAIVMLMTRTKYKTTHGHIKRINLSSAALPF